MAPSDGLDILEDIPFQDGEWRWERVGWAIMGVIVIAAMLGAFGHGLLGYRTAESTNGRLEVAYEAVARRGGGTGLETTMDADLADGGTLRLHVPSTYLEQVDVEAITPQPSAAILSGDGAVYEFTLRDPPPDTDIVVRFDLRPDAVGFGSADIEVVGGPSVHIDQLLLP